MRAQLSIVGTELAKDVTIHFYEKILETNRILEQ